MLRSWQLSFYKKMDNDLVPIAQDLFRTMKTMKGFRGITVPDRGRYLMVRAHGDADFGVSGEIWEWVSKPFRGVPLGVHVVSRSMEEA